MPTYQVDVEMVFYITKSFTFTAAKEHHAEQSAVMLARYTTLAELVAEKTETQYPEGIEIYSITEIDNKE